MRTVDAMKNAKQGIPEGGNGQLAIIGPDGNPVDQI